MKYRDLKDERDAAVARMLEAERLSMKSEFDRVTAEFEQEKARLQAMVSESTEAAYQRGFDDGKDAMAVDITARLTYRTALKPLPLPGGWKLVLPTEKDLVFNDPDTLCDAVPTIVVEGILKIGERT